MSYKDALSTLSIINHLLGWDVHPAQGAEEGHAEVATKKLQSSLHFHAVDLQLVLVDHGFGFHLPHAKLIFDALSVTHKTGVDLDKEDSEPTIAVWVQGNCRADFFNKLLKCWEPLLEPLAMQVVLEKSAERGSGLSLRIENEVHINFTTVLFSVILEIMAIVNSVNSEAQQKKFVAASPSRARGSQVERLSTQDGRWVDHSYTNSLHMSEKAAFSLINLCGHPCRFQYSKGVICYLDHNQRGLLNFVPSR